MFFFNLSHTQKNFKYIDMHKVVLKTSVSLKKKKVSEDIKTMKGTEAKESKWKSAT